VTSPRILISVAWILIVGIIFIGIGSTPLTDIDEGAFSEASREMLERSDWISPWLLDAPRFDKPVLIHWLQMISFSIFEITTFAARLPSAVASLIWIGSVGALAFRVSRKLLPGIDPLDAYLSAIVLTASTIGVPAIGRAATADALLNCLLVLSMLCIWIFFYEKSDRRYGRALSFFVGLGLLTKGPIAVLIPAAASIFAAIGSGLIMRESGHQKQAATEKHSYLKFALERWMHLVRDPLAWLIVIALCAPWYFLQFQAQGTAFIEGFFGTHNLGRFVSTMHGFSAGPWYYPGWILIATLPWTPLVIRTLIFVVRKGSYKNPELIMHWGIFLFVLVFFSFSATKLPHYGFYGLSGLIILMSIVLSMKTSRSDGAITSHGTLLPERLFLVFLFLVLSAIPLWWGLVDIKDPYYFTVWQRAGELFRQDGLCFLLPLVAGLGLVFLKSFIGLMLGGLIFSLTIHAFVVPTVITALRSPIVEAAEVLRPLPPQQTITWRLTAPSLSFYANRVVPAGNPNPGKLIVMHSKDSNRLAEKISEEGRPPDSIRVIWSSHGIQIVETR